MANNPDSTATASPNTLNPSALNPGTEIDSLLAPLRPIAKFKARSHDTSKEVHLPLLQPHIATANSDPNASLTGPTVVLLGDSMFERMTTTGDSPNFPSPWPSPTLYPEETLSAMASEDYPLNRLERVFNAGVGGDKVQNIAYRLVGDEERGLPGLLPALAGCGTVKVWVVQMGTNNLTAKKGLRGDDVKALETVVSTLLGVNPREGGKCQVLVTGLFYRKDVADELVERANQELKELTKVLEVRYGMGRLQFLWPFSVRDKIKEHMVDHVHLDLEGYRLWVEVLFLYVERMLRLMEREEEPVGDGGPGSESRKIDV